MTDVSGLVVYDRPHALVLDPPVGVEGELGVTFQVIHIDAISAEDDLFFNEKSRRDREIEQWASCIVSWDWGENTFKGTVPEFSKEKAVEVLTQCPWIAAQVRKAIYTMGNFTTASRLN